jgi:hypothetical protein
VNDTDFTSVGSKHGGAALCLPITGLSVSGTAAYPVYLLCAPVKCRDSASN